MSLSKHKYISLVAATVFALAQLACGSSNEAGSNVSDGSGGDGSGDASDNADSTDSTVTTTGSAEGGFESADPMAVDRDGPSSTLGVSSTTGGTTGGDSGDGDDGVDEPGRLIEEADIVQVVGDRLYAMSRYAGVAVIDMSDVDDLKLLGLHRVEATPFEMYVKDEVVFALYENYGEYVYDEAAQAETFVQSSSVVVLDASDPDELRELSRFTIPGRVSDSRMVGDILYVAAFENGSCWSCAQDQPRTMLMSLDVSEPTQVEKIDELSFDDHLDGGGWKHSLSANDERLYLAGPNWQADNLQGSVLRVVDISDPAGDLVEGATLQVAGQLDSRWQVDEYEGVLRVISQPFDVDLSIPPRVDTFRVNSSDDFDPLASLSLSLPMPERLESVRFDGERAYAITVEEADPLFTIDLSDPEAPEQGGQLEMPGWVYHMEPRGDRVVALGIDWNNPEGSLTVSLFDVSELEAPGLLSRIHIPSSSGSLAEDRDRIHKAFTLLDDAGLIAVPFEGSLSPYDTGECFTTWIGGVQLIDWQSDELTVRGVAQVESQARRGFLHDERLVTIADHSVDVFDISDRDVPLRTSDVPLSQYVARTLAAGDQVLRIGATYDARPLADVASLDTVNSPRAAPGLSVGFDRDEVCTGDAYLRDASSTGDKAYLVFTGNNDIFTGESLGLRIQTLDLSGDDAPTLAGTVNLDLDPRNYMIDYTSPLSREIVRAGESLVFSERDGDGADLTLHGLYVVDVSDPNSAEPEYLELPLGRAAGGLFVDGSMVARSHFSASERDPTRVRYYLDRADLSEPGNPKLLPPLNTPGTLIALEGDRALLLDFQDRVIDDASVSECYANQRVVSFVAGDDDRGKCTVLVEVLTLVRLDGETVEILGTEPLPTTEAIAFTAVGDGVVFALLGSDSFFSPSSLGACIECTYNENAKTLLSVSGLSGGEFSVGRLERDWGQAGSLVASGKRALVTGYLDPVTVVDASDPLHPEVAKEVWPVADVRDLTVVGSTAVVSMGQNGAAAIPLD